MTQKEKVQLDYDRLIEDWAEEILKKADSYKERMDKEDTDTYHYGLYKGMREAFHLSLAQLRFLEERKKDKYAIKKETKE